MRPVDLPPGPDLDANPRASAPRRGPAVTRFLESLFGAPESTLSSSAATRLGVTPPPLRHAPDSRWARVLCWLMSPGPGASAPPLARLPAVKADFAAAMADLRHDDSRALAQRIERAASLRELWHLRCDLHLLLSRHLSESEAERRLVPLHRHFPGGLPRSSFRR